MTNNDQYPDLPGPLAHTPPLFLHLNVLTVFDIFKLQLGKFVYDAVNNIGPANKIINFNMASTIHSYNTRYANQGNFSYTGCFFSWFATMGMTYLTYGENIFG